MSLTFPWFLSLFSHCFGFPSFTLITYFLSSFRLTPSLHYKCFPLTFIKSSQHNLWNCTQSGLASSLSFLHYIFLPARSVLLVFSSCHHLTARPCTVPFCITPLSLAPLPSHPLVLTPSFSDSHRSFSLPPSPVSPSPSQFALPLHSQPVIFIFTVLISFHTLKPL